MKSHYDLFISYSHKDKEWVSEWLVPHLEDEGLEVCIDYRDFEIGSPIVKNIEKAVERSEKTILVLTPAWISSEWTTYENILDSTEDPAGYKRQLVPLLLEDCDIPTRLSTLTYADFTNEENWSFELDRVIGALRTQSNIEKASEAEIDDADEASSDTKYFEECQISLAHLLSLQYPWGEWSDRRTALESRMGERRNMRGVEGPKPNVARTMYSLEAIEPFIGRNSEYHQRTADWIKNSIHDGWFREWTLGATRDSETSIPNLVYRKDVRHTAESITVLSRRQNERSPLDKLINNISSSSLESGYWPATPNGTDPQLLATVYSIEALGRIINEDFRLSLSDLLSNESVNKVRSAFRQGHIRLEDDCNKGDGLLGSDINDKSPYLTGIALYRLAPIAEEIDGIKRISERMVKKLLEIKREDGWRNTAVPADVRGETVKRTTLRVAAGLFRARQADIWTDEDPWRDIQEMVSGYITGQEVLELDAPDHACLLLVLTEGNNDYQSEIDIGMIEEEANELKRQYIEHWKTNFEEYLSRLEEGRTYGIKGYDELGESLEEKVEILRSIHTEG